MELTGSDRVVVVPAQLGSVGAGPGRAAGGGLLSPSVSGLLNALDGVGGAEGQIFILTTNLRDELGDWLLDSYFDYSFR